MKADHQLKVTRRGGGPPRSANDVVPVASRRILVAGGTGVLGRPLVRALVAAGHTVFATSRSERSAATVRGLGSRPVDADLLDRSALDRAIRAARPDAIFHVASAIPSTLSPRHIARQMRPTGELRTVGARNLVDLGRQGGSTRIIAASIAFAYAARDGADAVEDEPLDVSAGGGWGEVTRAVSAMESTLINGSHDEHVVLRFGYVYGPGSAFARDGAIASMVSRGRFPIVGPGTGRWSFVHTDDAAAALVSALDAPSGIYNIVDDSPRSVSDWLPSFAEALGARPPRHVPAWLARLAAGEHSVRSMVHQRGASNAKAVRDLGWRARQLDWTTALDELDVAR